MKTGKTRNLIIFAVFGLYKTTKTSNYEQSHNIINDTYPVSLDLPNNSNINYTFGKMDFNFEQFSQKNFYNSSIYSQKQQVIATSRQNQQQLATETDIHEQHSGSLFQQQTFQPDCVQTQYDSYGEQYDQLPQQQTFQPDCAQTQYDSLGQQIHIFPLQQPYQPAYVHTQYDSYDQWYDQLPQNQTFQMDCTQTQHDSLGQQIHTFPQQQLHQTYFKNLQYGNYDLQGPTNSHEHILTSNDIHCDLQLKQNKNYPPDLCQHSFVLDQSNGDETHYNQLFQDLNGIISTENHENIQSVSPDKQSHQFCSPQESSQQQGAALSRDFHHLPTSQMQFDEGQPKNTVEDDILNSISYDVLASQNTTFSEENLPNNHGTFISSKRCLEKDSYPGNEAKRSKIDVHTPLLNINGNCLENLLNSTCVQQDSVPENSYCLQPKTSENIDVRLLTYEETFKKITTEYSMFESLNVFECFDFIKNELSKFHFVSICDPHIDLTLENLNSINWSIDYSNDEKNEIKKFEHELGIIFDEMDSSIPYDLSLEHIEKLISDSKKYVEIERALFNNLINEDVFQKYILNIISKIFKENELNLSMIFCEIQSLKTLIFLNYKTMFYRGSMLQLVYLFKIMELYVKESEILRKHILDPVKSACNNTIKPTRYILRRIILEVLYISSISQNHIRFFSIISHLEMLIYKIIKIKKIKKPLVKNFFLLIL